ncbi:MAG: class II glutamine amidotransferase [Gammaproteobacteria bacterium]
MCELLGMSANTPTDICFSFSGLMQRGGRTGPHKDGWGIGFYEGRACRLFHDPRPSAVSEVAKLIQQYSIKSHVVISHIRKANRGRVCLANTHPFSRELWGSNWVFAHNGQLKGIKNYPLNTYHPVGTTDSEHAFCWLLGRIRKRFPERPQQETALITYIRKLACELDGLGIFNFMLSDAVCLYVHCSNRMCWLTRRAPFGKAQLIDTEMSVDFKEFTTPKDVVTVVASRPLTDNETWNRMGRGEFVVFKKGEVISSL